MWEREGPVDTVQTALTGLFYWGQGNGSGGLTDLFENQKVPYFPRFSYLSGYFSQNWALYTKKGTFCKEEWIGEDAFQTKKELSEWRF